MLVDTPSVAEHMNMCIGQWMIDKRTWYVMLEYKHY